MVTKEVGDAANRVCAGNGGKSRKKVRTACGLVQRVLWNTFPYILLIFFFIETKGLKCLAGL